MKTLLLSFSVLFIGSMQFSFAQNTNYLLWGPEFLINNRLQFDYYKDADTRNALFRENKVHSVKIVKVKKDGKRELATEKSTMKPACRSGT